MAKTAVVDKWKSKKFFELYAPKEIFNEVYIGETFASDYKSIPGRIIEAPLSAIFGAVDAKHQKIKLIFKTEEAKGTHVSTKFLGHTTVQDYERGAARKRISKVYVNLVVSTKDNKKLRLKSLMVTLRNVNKAKQGALGKQLCAFFESESKAISYNELITSILSGKLSIKAKKAVHSVYPVRQVVIQKTEIL